MPTKHFIRNLLNDIINNALGNLKKSSHETKITTCHTNETSTIVHQFTSDDAHCIEKGSFPLWISSVNVAKCAVS